MASGQANSIAGLARTLEFAYEVIAGTVHGGPHFLISLFSPPYMLFLVFFYKIGFYDPDLA
jgi:hypothetical protein